MTFVADSAGAKRVGDRVREVLAGHDELKIAVAFVGANSGDLLGVDLRRRKVSLICDATSGFCNPHELRQLAKRANIDSRYLPGLHAKVFITKSAVVVGSANVSGNALTHGSLEAVTISTDSQVLREANEWFDGLKKSSKPLKKFVESPAFRDLLARWPKSSDRSAVPTLLGALLGREGVLNSFVVGFHEAESELSERKVRTAAQAKGIEIPLSDRWEWYEEPFTKEADQAHHEAFADPDRKLITFEIRTEGSGKQERIVKFVKLDPQVGQYMGHHQFAGCLVSHFVTAEPSGLYLAGVDARKLCDLLTKIVGRDPSAGRRLLQQKSYLSLWDELRAVLSATS